MNMEHYQAALDADEAFHRECVRQFGELAGDCRYQPELHDETTSQARTHYQESISRLFPNR